MASYTAIVCLALLALTNGQDPEPDTVVNPNNNAEPAPDYFCGFDATLPPSKPFPNIREPLYKWPGFRPTAYESRIELNRKSWDNKTGTSAYARETVFARRYERYYVCV